MLSANLPDVTSLEAAQSKFNEFLKDAEHVLKDLPTEESDRESKRLSLYSPCPRLC
jgi:hypothetical protein